MSLACRGVRGAITITANTTEDVLAQTRLMLMSMVVANGIEPADIASIWFTTTPDITAVAPARTARAELGWTYVPMLCTTEMPVDGSLPMCIRALLHWNTAVPQAEIKHIFLGETTKLRPDLAGEMDAILVEAKEIVKDLLKANR